MTPSIFSSHCRRWWTVIAKSWNRRFFSSWWGTRATTFKVAKRYKLSTAVNSHRQINTSNNNKRDGTHKEVPFPHSSFLIFAALSSIFTITWLSALRSVLTITVCTTVNNKLLYARVLTGNSLVISPSQPFSFSATSFTTHSSRLNIWDVNEFSPGSIANVMRRKGMERKSEWKVRVKEGRRLF